MGQFHDSTEVEEVGVDVVESKDKKEELLSLVKAAFQEPVKETVLAEENLTRYLRCCNWNVQEARDMFLSSVQLVRDYPQYSLAPSACPLACAAVPVWVSPNRDSNGSRVVFLRLGQWDPSSVPTEQLYSLTFALFRLISTEPKTQVGGCIIIADLTGFGFKHLRALGIAELRCLGSFLSGCFPVWFRNIHFVNNPRLFNTLFSILKGFLSENIKNCTKFHGSSTKELVSLLPAKLLPIELGGECTEAQLESHQCLDALDKHEKEVMAGLQQLQELSSNPLQK